MLSRVSDEGVKLAGDEWVVAYFDGLCEPNPGGCACGGWVVEAHAGLLARAPAASAPATAPATAAATSNGSGITGCRCYGHGPEWTGNMAEYQAALDALRAVYGAGWRGPVRLHGDSKLVVSQVTGDWACNAPRLQEMLTRLHHAMTFFDGVQLVWIPRERNAQADALSRRAYEEATGRHAPDRPRRG